MLLVLDNRACRRCGVPGVLPRERIVSRARSSHFLQQMSTAATVWMDGSAGIGSNSIGVAVGSTIFIVKGAL